MERRYDISVLRIVSTLAVVFLHTCSTLLDNPAQFAMSNEQNLVFRIFSHSMRWAVPVFFIITGMLLLDSNRVITPKDCIKKYAFRMLLALSVFGIPFAMMQILMETKTMSASVLPKAVLAVINNDGWRHLWYIYVLIGIYLMLPVIKAFSDHATQSEMRYVLVCMFIFNFCTPLIDKLCGTTIGVTLPVTYSVFYVLLGKLLSVSTPRVLRKRSTVITLLVLLLGILVLIEVFFPSYVDAIRSYDSPLIAIMAYLMYLCFKDISITHHQSIIWKLDRLCFGVYIIHPFFIHLFYKFFKITPLGFKVYPIVTFVFFCGFLILSFITSFLLGLIKPLKKYVL